MKINKIRKVIFSAIDELNQQLCKEDRLEKSLETGLFGANSNLDSLELVNLIVAVEQNIEDEFGTNIILADERAMSQKHSPFRTIGSLSDYITMLLEEIND
jgi:D-alanine--poly(phosphoribitol) ligase subunit 2